MIKLKPSEYANVSVTLDHGQSTVSVSGTVTWDCQLWVWVRVWPETVNCECEWECDLRLSTVSVSVTWDCQLWVWVRLSITWRDWRVLTPPRPVTPLPVTTDTRSPQHCEVSVWSYHCEVSVRSQHCEVSVRSQHCEVRVTSQQNHRVQRTVKIDFPSRVCSIFSSQLNWNRTC